MKLLRLALPLTPALAFLLAMGTAAEPPRPVAPQALALDDEALDVSPAPRPGQIAPPERDPAAAGLPAAARSGAWRSGARPPGDVPPSVVVRAAMRNGSPGGTSDPLAGREADAPHSIEIVWHAPGS